MGKRAKWKNILPDLKMKIRRLFQATKIILSRAPPKSHDPFIKWLDDNVMGKFVNTIPNEPKYADLKKNAALVRKIVYALTSQDPYYERATMHLVYLIRGAPEPPVPEWVREWIEQHYGVKLPPQVKEMK